MVMTNQKGGVAKTTTTLALARYLADRGLRVLIIDTDPQGSVGAALGLKPQNYFHQFVVNNFRFDDCVVPAGDNIQVLCSNRQTQETEATLMGRVGREMTFKLLFTPWDETRFDAVLIDVAPSINLLQTCALVYAQQMLIPIDMDMLSLQGTLSAIETASLLNGLFQTKIQAVGMLPVKVDKRLGMTEAVLDSAKKMGEKYGIPVLDGIRIDSTVSKATRSRQFLADFDPHCKALEDYTATFDRLFPELQFGVNGKQAAQA